MATTQSDKAQDKLGLDPACVCVRVDWGLGLCRVPLPMMLSMAFLPYATAVSQVQEARSSQVVKARASHAPSVKQFES